MDGKTILPRSEVPEEFTWDLRDVFASDEAWNDELEALKAYPERMAAFAGRLGESAKTLLDWFTLGDEVNVRVTKLVEYASCRSDQDVGNSFYQGMRSKAFSMAVTLNSALARGGKQLLALGREDMRLAAAQLIDVAAIGLKLRLLGVETCKRFVRKRHDLAIITPRSRPLST